MTHNHGNHKLVLCQECDLVYCKGHCERTWERHLRGQRSVVDRQMAGYERN